MAIVKITESILEDIADAIRAKKNTQETYTPANMATAISSITSGGGSSSTGYSITYPTNLTNQFISISDISTTYTSNGIRNYRLSNAKITLRPDTGYIAGTIFVDGVDTNSQEVTLTNHQDTVITVSNASIKPVSGYIMDGSMRVGKHVVELHNGVDDLIILGFNTTFGDSNIVGGYEYLYREDMYIGGSLNTDIEFTQWGNTITDHLTDLIFAFRVIPGTLTMVDEYGTDQNNMQANEYYEQNQSHQSTWTLHIGNINGTEGTDYFTFIANPYNNFFNNNAGTLSSLTMGQNLLNYLNTASINNTMIPIRISEVSS